MLRLTTFGGLALSRDGVALTGAAAQRSRLSLLALLALAGPTGFSREKLLLYLWPESDEERARHALKQAVYALRRELGADEVIVGTASLSLNPVLITSDAREFEAAVAAGDHAAAVALYTGPFLDGFHLRDSTEFERWSAEQRARFAHLWASSLEKLATECEARGAWREAAGHWRSLAAAEPLSGRFALALMKALAASGDVGAALQQCRIHEALVREELGGTPDAAVVSFADALRNGTWTPPVSATAVSPTAPAAPVRPTDSTDTGATSASPAAEPPAGAANVAEPRTTLRSGPHVAIGAARRRRRRSTTVAFVLGMLMMTATALGVGYATMDAETRAALNLIRTRPAPTLEPRQIVVAPFENMTGDATLDPMGDQIADWFARELGEADFKVVDARTARIGSKVVEGIPRPLRPGDANVALGEETGSAYAVVGKYYRAGDSVQANVSVIDVGTRHTVKALGPFYGSPRRMDDFIQAMLTPTIGYLGAEVDTSAGGLTTKYASPPSLEVQRRVNAAWEHFFRSPRDTTSVFAELDTAARLDSTYAVPLLMKAYMLDVKSRWPGVSALVERVRPLAPRMSKLERAALDLLEADLRGDALARPGIARRLQAMSPGSAEMPLLRVVSALYVGNVREALLALGETDPTRGMNLIAPSYLEWAAVTYHHAGDVLREERAVREALRRFRHHPPATFELARIYAARNDLASLDELLADGVPPARDPADPRDPALEAITLRLFAARELRAHGHPEGARRIMNELVARFARGETSRTLRDASRWEARVYYEAGDYRHALMVYGALLAADSTDVEAMGRVATSSVHLGDRATAARLDAKLKTLRLPFTMGGANRWRASIAAVEGRTDDALALLDAAVRRGHRLMDTPPNFTVHLDPDFTGIEDTPGFRALLQSLTDATSAK